MRFQAVLNRDGGTLRRTDLDAFGARLTQTLENAGHTVTLSIVSGKEIVDTIDRAARSRADVVLAGGGDGTISAAAARLKDSRKALAILPAGTMNLFARGLGIPLGLDAAVEAFAGGEVRAVDVASANGRPFVHQFSVGMHARMVKLRDGMAFKSRPGKIVASARAAFEALRNPPAFNVRLKIGEAEVLTRTTGIGITNNLFGEGHLPYADSPEGGMLGIYVTVARQRGELLRFVLNMARGRWRDNDQVEIHESDRVEFEVRSRRRKLHAVIDGELIDFERRIEFRIHPGALNVLVPAAAAKSEARAA